MGTDGEALRARLQAWLELDGPAHDGRRGAARMLAEPLRRTIDQELAVVLQRAAATHGVAVAEVEARLLAWLGHVERRRRDGRPRTGPSTPADATVRLGWVGADHHFLPRREPSSRETSPPRDSTRARGPEVERTTADDHLPRDPAASWATALDECLQELVREAWPRDPSAAGSTDDALALARAVRAAGEVLVPWLARPGAQALALWQQPRLIVDAGWCVSVAWVPPSLRAEVLASAAQRAEWRALLGLPDAAPETLDAAWLDAHPYLVVDTRHFDDRFEERLLDSLGPEVLGSAHLAIGGDNLDALRLLARQGLRPRCIFIDPPYNTGSRAFSYRDAFAEGDWLSMMHDRLHAAHGLLAQDGALVATIDDGEVAPLRLLLESIFGSANFVAQAVWHKKYARQNDATWFSTSHDHVLVAARDKLRWRPNPLPRSSRTNRAYRNRDDDPRGPWQSVVYTCNKDADERPNLYYAITHPRTGEPVWPQRNRVWAFSAEAHARNEQERRVWWGADGELAKPRLKVFLRDVEGGVVPDTLWSRDDVGDNQEAQRELAALFGVREGFTSPKPTRLLRRVLALCSDPGDVVLDFFAGSGTTAHAVLAANRSHEGPPRRFVVVEAGETFDDVLVPRIKKVAACSRWRDGRAQDHDGGPMACRVLYLESYDDRLARMTSADGGDPLGPEALRDPFEARITVERHGIRRHARVAWIDTFAFLLGLRVTRVGPSERSGPEAPADERAPRMRAIWGTTAEHGRVLAIWRTLGAETEAEAEADADAEADARRLGAFLHRTLDGEEAPAAVWINGPFDEATVRRPGDRFVLRRTEDELRQRLGEPKPLP